MSLNFVDCCYVTALKTLAIRPGIERKNSEGYKLQSDVLPGPLQTSKAESFATIVNA